MGTIQDEFPVWGLLPKKETGVTSFLAKYPEYDGRGLVIAIFDSGVDPGAPGLQVTSDGNVKVVERFDCSGSGDVATTTIVQAENGFLTGLTGRKLKVPSSWKNPTNNFRLGVKNAFELYPEKLRERMQEEYKEKKWDSPHRLALADATRQLGKFDAKFTNQNLSEAEKLEKEDLEAKVDLLNTYEKKFADCGSLYDCVLFHDGSKWVCCIDTSMQGELDGCPVLGEYSETHEYVPLTTADQLNVTMNVHDDGNVLELVGLCSSHGTHVASITAAYFPDDPDRSGVAPGAQIVSLTIGDGRLGSMETGTSLVRAMIKVIELQKKYPIKVINMSYGEQAHWSNTGRVGDLMNEVVNKYGIVWVAAGGNQGPALSTIGTPPDISQDTIIGVGAYVSPDMMVAEYSMRQKLKGMPYTWSSRGPTIDGGFGISICAPGGAITSVPNFTLRSSQLMNGTSMASPQVAGAVGLLLSGLMQKGVPFSPYNVKRGMENNAQFLEDGDVFAQGSGLLQVDKAFDWLVDTQTEMDRDVRFHVLCVSGTSTKGIYIRSKLYSNTQEFSVAVEPYFLMTDTVEPAVKINFNMKLVLTCNATYVSHPKHLDLANMVRVFGVKIDTEGLPHGIHSTQVVAYDTANLRKGPVFRIPITIINPQEIKTADYKIAYKSTVFKPNTIKRHFYVVPENATLGVLRLRSNDTNNKGRFVIHCMQILPKQSARSFEFTKHTYVSSNTESTLHFQTRPGLVLEVVVAKFWADLGDINLDYSISFHGIKPNQPTITMHAAEGIHSVQVTSLQGEEIVPLLQLKQTVQVLKPNEAKVNPLTSRDVVPPGRQIYELLLVYNFHLSKATEVSPNSALLSNLLYESEFESQMWMLFDSNKQFLGCGDAYPSKYSVKLEKGDYVIRMQIRHDKKEYLDKLIDIPLLLNQKLATAVVLDVYHSHSQAVIGGKKANYTLTTSPVTIPFYVTPLTQEKFSAKTNNAAHYLLGQASFCKDESAKKADNYPIKYILYDNTKKSTKPAEKDKTKQEEYTEALRDLKSSWLAKLDITANADALYEELEKEFPDHLVIHTSYLQSFDALEHKRQLPLQDPKSISTDDMKKIINVCDKVLNNINQESLLAYFAVKTDLRTDASKIKSQMERQKNVFIECLCRKGVTLCRLHLLSQSGEDVKEKGVTVEEISTVYQTLVKFVDPNDAKMTLVHVFYFLAWHATVCNQYGRVLKYLTKISEEKPSREIEEKIMEVCSLNKWQHLVDHLKRSLPVKYPVAYRLF